MNIIIGTIILFALALFSWNKLAEPDRRSEAIAGTLATLRVNLPRLAVALIGAGFFAELLPEEAIDQYLGARAGLRAIFLGALLGFLTPGGPFVSFALAAAAATAGASTPAIIAYLSAWALLGFTRIISEELAIMGPAFLAKRIALTVWIPIACGLLAFVLLKGFGG